MKFLLVLLAFVAVIQAFVPRVQQRPGSLKLAAAKEEVRLWHIAPAPPRPARAHPGAARLPRSAPGLIAHGGAVLLPAPLSAPLLSRPPARVLTHPNPPTTPPPPPPPPTQSNTLGKTDLLDILKDATGVSKKDVETVLTAFQAAVREQVLEGGKEIRLRDFGTFKRKESVARVGRNPRTGEELQISGSKSVSFSVSQAMKIKDTPSKAKPAPKKK